MRIQVKVNNDDKLGLNKKWFRTFLLVFALIFILGALTHIILDVFKPKSYGAVLSILSDNPYQQLLLGALILNCYFIIKRSKRI
jgi:hypothetical protein